MNQAYWKEILSTVSGDKPSHAMFITEKHLTSRDSSRILGLSSLLEIDRNVISLREARGESVICTTIRTRQALSAVSQAS